MSADQQSAINRPPVAVGAGRWPHLAAFAGRWPLAAGLTASALVLLSMLLAVGALYGDALGYAFMYDDGLDLTRGEGRSVLSLLTSGEGAFYYRPLPFVLWKGLHGMIGRYDPFWFHLLPLVVHALNGWLLYQMARALGVRSMVAGLASALFVTFPFHYQAVPWAGALFHPLVTALVLSSLLAYRAARRSGARRYWLLSLTAAALALFTHESAVTVGVLAAGLEWWMVRRGDVNRWRPYALVYLGLALAFAGWWLSVPKWPRTFTPDLEAIGRNTLMYLQALLWPLALTWRWAPPPLLDRPEQVVATVGPLAVGMAAWCIFRARRAELAGLAAGWLIVTALPVWATLPRSTSRTAPGSTICPRLASRCCGHFWPRRCAGRVAHNACGARWWRASSAGC